MRSKHFLSYLFLFLLISVGLGVQSFAKTQKRVTVPDTLVVIHVNDSHSHLLPFGRRNESGVSETGGLARIATLVKETRTHEKNILFFHAGDLFVGDLMWDRFLGFRNSKCSMN